MTTASRPSDCTVVVDLDGLPHPSTLLTPKALRLLFRILADAAPDEEGEAGE